MLTQTKSPILLIEDSPDDESLAIHAFKKNKRTNPIIVARDGIEAINYLFGDQQVGSTQRQVKELPALVLLDLKLPRIDGLEVLRRIRANKLTALLPVVILTTSGEPRDIQQAYLLGANSYIRKPVCYQDFTRALDETIHYWLELNVPG